MPCVWLEVPRVTRTPQVEVGATATLTEYHCGDMMCCVSGLVAQTAAGNVDQWSAEVLQRAWVDAEWNAGRVEVAHGW